MMNLSSEAIVTLDGLAQLFEHRFVFLLLFLLLYVFVIVSDGLVVYVICSQRSLHRPMYVFVGALLINSVVASSVLYPKLMWDLLLGTPFVAVSRAFCLCQAFVSGALGGSCFMLLSAMALDRYLSICHPLRYAALMTPAAVTTMLLVSWLLPAFVMAGLIVLVSHLQPCLSTVARLFCNTYTVIGISCGGRGRVVSEVYSLLTIIILALVPIAFVLFSYGRILVVCLQRSRTFSSKALSTCLPHVIVFMKYSVSAVFELLHRRIHSLEQTPSITTNVLVLVVPTVCDPVVYGLKVGEIYQKLKKLFHCYK